MTKQRTWTEEIFAGLRKAGFHPVDVEYGDGYFIFRLGEDKVVHFYVEELKGWKFGIWWDAEEKRLDFFTQFERDIDKFKPSASTFALKGREIDRWLLEDIVRICRFIKKHPYRAWKLDQTYDVDIWAWDDLDKAFWEYWSTWWRECRGNKIHKRTVKKYLKLVRLIADECLVNPKIKDWNVDGFRCSPRFGIVCDGIVDEKLKPGHYVLQLEEELSEGLVRKVRRYNKQFDKLEKKYRELGDVFLGETLGFAIRKKV